MIKIYVLFDTSKLKSFVNVNLDDYCCFAYVRIKIRVPEWKGACRPLSCWTRTCCALLLTDKVYVIFFRFKSRDKSLRSKGEFIIILKWCHLPFGVCNNTRGFTLKRGRCAKVVSDDPARSLVRSPPPPPPPPPRHGQPYFILFKVNFLWFVDILN